MNRFFRDLARHFPRDSGGAYTRRMNWGEYVHFTSGAAAADMSGLAARAFGWPREWADQLERPRAISRHHVLKYRGRPPSLAATLRSPSPRQQGG